MMGGICCKRKSQNSNANNGSKTEVISSIEHPLEHIEFLELDPSKERRAAVSSGKEYKNKTSKFEVTASVASDRAADESVTESFLHLTAEVPAEVNGSLQPVESCDPEQSRGTEEYRRTFTAYYARLCEALPVEQILPELVSNEVITVHEMEEVLSEKTSIAKARVLLSKHIFKEISAGCPEVLRILLSIMCHSSNHACKVLSREMCTKLNIAAALPVDTSYTNAIQHLTHQMGNFQQYLRSKYKVLELTSPDEMLDCASTEYIDLTLIKSNQQNRIGQVQDGDSITLSEALDVQGQKGKIILILGGPGMGKSTLAINICKRWAKGELLQVYDAVILLPLREKEIQEAKTLGVLLLILDDKMREDVSKEIVMNNGRKVCFICEGFDELPRHLRKSSLVAKLIPILPECTVIYTSRPEASSELHATKTIAIDGFKEKSIDKYISKTFENIENGKEMASQLKSEVKSNDWIRRIFHVPINVAIVCLIFYHFSVLPDTLTQLYTLLFLRLILRHITTRTPNVAQISQLTSLNDLPPDIAGQFSQLCFIAYKGMANGQAVFSSQDLRDMEVIEENMSGLGLLLITPSFSVYGRGKSYSFLHLTLQEFSAAWYLSKLPPKEQLKQFKNSWLDHKLRMVWMFYCGITGLKSKEVLYSMLSCSNKAYTSFFTNKTTVDIILSVYEAHNSEVCQEVGNYLEGNVYISYHQFASYTDERGQAFAYALAYFITEYTGVCRVDYCSSRNTEVLSTLIESLKNRSELLFHNGTSLSIGNLILHVAFVYVPSLLTSLIELLAYYPVTELSLSGDEVSVEALSQIICTKNLKVLSVSVKYNKLNITKPFNFPITNSLCDLRMSGSWLSSIIDDIGEIFSQCKSITFVDFSFSGLGDNGIKILVSHLNNNNTLQHLNLSDNNITVIGIDHLRRLMMSDHLALTSVVLSHNPLKDEGVCLFLQAVTNFMESMEFEEVSMTSSSYEYVADVLHKVRSISFTICDDSEIIGSSLSSATMLEKIKLSALKGSCCNMINGINQNSNIKTATFSYHYGASPMDCERLLKHPFTELNIDYFPYESLLDMADLLAVNTSIKRFKVSVVPDESPKEYLLCFLYFIEKVASNYMLEELAVRVTDDIYIKEVSDEISWQFCQYVGNYIKLINDTRSTSNPLKVYINNV